jgi:hypothetical protein
VAEIDRHHPVASEIWFLYLGTGVSLGGFLWLVLPQYQWLRQTIGAWAIDLGWTWIGESGPAWLMVVHPESREVFVWLDFLMIVGWMVGVMLALTVVLAALNALTSCLAGRSGAAGPFRDRFVVAGYQVTPPAMISLLLGLGVGLFALLPAAAAMALKVALLAIAVVWGTWLGWRLLGRIGLAGARRAMTLVPGIVASLLIAAAWWPAVVGG